MGNNQFKVLENCFLIHDNWNRPFKVIVDNNKVKIYKKDKVIKIYDVKEVFIGDSEVREDTDDDLYGNTFLLELKDRYVYVGPEIYEFPKKDKVRKYYSTIGKNDVPYPIAVGEKNIYFLFDKKYVLKRFVKHIDEDMYQDYYKMENVNLIKNLKMVHERTFE